MGLNEFAKKVSIAPPYLSQLERGVKTNPSKEVMERISNALEKTVQEVFFPEEKKEGRKCVTG